MGILIMLKEGKTSTVLESGSVISDSFVKSFPDPFEADFMYVGIGVARLGRTGMGL